MKITINMEHLYKFIGVFFYEVNIVQEVLVKLAYLYAHLCDTRFIQTICLHGKFNI
jgi:hypothetical protein